MPLIQSVLSFTFSKLTCTLYRYWIYQAVYYRPVIMNVTAVSTGNRSISST